MGFMKRMAALLLILVMSFALVLDASAAGSPTTGPETQVENPGYDTATDLDTNTQDHNRTTVTTEVKSDAATVKKVESEDRYVTLEVARDQNNEAVSITKIGDGSNGVFSSKSGQKITSVTISSDKKVTLNTKAMRKSKVSKIVVKSRKIKIYKDAFNGTKQKKVKIYLKGSKKASDVTLAKGAFKGLSKDSQIIVSKKSMSASQFKKLVKKLVAAGFTGKIVRK